MKKLVFVAFALVAMAFASCGEKQTAIVENGVDTTAVDTTVADTAAVDTVVAE